MAPVSPVLNVMTRAAQKAARHLKRDFGEVENLQVSRKGPADFVSAADIRAEKILREELSRARPGYGFLLEEAGAVPGAADSDRLWVVDPLDGTTNFLHGLPHFAISIALVERGEIIAGCVYDPAKDEMFTAEKGVGAFLNDRRLRVSARRRLDEALFATGIPFKGLPNHERYLRQLARVMAETSGVRRYGAAALDLAWMAAGRYDGFWEMGLKPWDFAAGVILVREAGGMVTTLEGDSVTLDSSSLVAANELLHRELDKLLREAG